MVMLVFFSVGCSKTDLISSSINSVVDPEFVNVKYNNILVFSSISDIGWRKKFETSVSNELNNAGVNSYNSIDLLPPTKEYDQEDLNKVIDKYNIEGVLILNVTNADIIKDYYTTPKQGYTSKSGSGYIIGNNIYTNESETYYETGGQTYEFNKPTMTVEAKIFDTRYNAWSWICQVSTYGPAITNFQDLIDKSAIDITDKLIEDKKIKEISKDK
jgi:hypothetical protein